MMNRIGIYYAYWTREWDADFHPYIDKVADLGFDVLEINAGTAARMTPAERRELRSHAADRDITLTYCIGLAPDCDIASQDTQVAQRGEAFLNQISPAVGEMGGGKVGGNLYGAWPMTLPAGDTDRRPYLERSISIIRRAARVAADHNVIFNLEVVNRFEQFLMNTCAEGIDYLNAVGAKNVRLLLDTFHMNIEEDFIEEAILRAGDHLGHFHIGENNRMPPGYGSIPWTRIAAALRKIGYTGDVVMEPFVQPGGQVGADIRVYRDLSAGLDLDSEARKALHFMRGVLK